MSTLWVRHSPTGVTTARTSVLAAFRAAGVVEDGAQDAALIASELVGNSVRHAAALPSGQLSLDWTLEPHGYLLSVTDGGAATGTAITAQALDPGHTGGRGLLIVSTLARAWGVWASAGSTTVWAQVDAESVVSPSGRQPAHHP